MRKKFALVGGVAGGLFAATIAAAAAFIVVNGVGTATGVIAGRVDTTPKPVVVEVTTPVITVDDVPTNIGVTVTNPNTVPVSLSNAVFELVSATPAQCAVLSMDPSFQQLEPISLAPGASSGFYSGMYEVGANNPDPEALSIPDCNYQVQVTVYATIAEPED